MAAVEPVLDYHVSRYEESHSNPVNQAFHFAGIPILMVSALGLLSKATGPALPTLPVAAGVGMFYGSWDQRAAVLLAGIVAACHATGRRYTTHELLLMLAIGAVLHVVGHYEFEQKPPALISRPIAILEAPAWLITHLLGVDSKP